MKGSPGCPAPRGRPKDEALAAKRRNEILRAAIAHFAAHGYHNADLDAIAANLGCAKGTLYHYFENKADLLRQSLDLIMGELHETCREPTDDPVADLEHSITEFLAFFDAHPEYVELIVQERAEFRDRKNPAYFEYRNPGTFRCTEWFKDAVAKGFFRDVPPERAIEAIGDRMYGTVFVNHFAGRTKTLEQQAADVVDVLFLGLLTPAAAERWKARQRRDGDEGKDASQ